MLLMWQDESDMTPYEREKWEERKRKGNGRGRLLQIRNDPFKLPPDPTRGDPTRSAGRSWFAIIFLSTVIWCPFLLPYQLHLNFLLLLTRLALTWPDLWVLICNSRLPFSFLPPLPPFHLNTPAAFKGSSLNIADTFRGMERGERKGNGKTIIANQERPAYCWPDSRWPDQIRGSVLHD